MHRSFGEMVEEVRRFWRNYVFQSLLATLTIFVALLVFTRQHPVIIASLGATAFIVFAMPESDTAEARHVVGGHLVGLLCGSVCASIPLTPVKCTGFHSAVAYSLAVGFSIFIMVSADIEHPPASGTALGVAITGTSMSLAAAIMSSVVILSLAHYFLRPVLRDLM
jgi:CBS-domain-containing membrane protein